MDSETRIPEGEVPQGGGADGDVLSALLRYRERNQWSWNLTMRLINMYYGTHYTEKQLRSLYKTHIQKN